MNWNPKTWKFNWKGDKERWIILLAVGLIFLILAFPTGKKNVTTRDDFDSGSTAGAGYGFGGSSTADSGTSGGYSGSSGSGTGGVYGDAAGSGYGGGYGDSVGNGSATGGTVQNTSLISASLPAAAAPTLTYEQRLEERLKEILSHVDGVGAVDVMIVLRSSEERVWLTDRDTNSSSTRETDSGGGSRQIQSQEIREETVLTGQSGSAAPVLEKEVYPEISGVIVSAAGGGSPVVQAEISAAVEALFGVPSHKIKILKRVE